MIRFNILLALRSMLKHKVTSGINLVGLSVAFTALILILMYVMNEFSYDRYHANADRIYRVTREGIDATGKPDLHFGHVNFAFAVHVQNDFPQTVERIIRFADFSNSLITNEENKKAFVESRLFSADPEVFQVFSWKVLKGDPATALAGLNTVAISTSAAARYFGAEDPIGKTLDMRLDMRDYKVTLTVTAVFEDVPANSHFKPDMLITMRTREKIEGLEDLMRNPSNNDATYLLLKPGASIATLKDKVAKSLDKYYEMNSDGSKSSERIRYYFWPLKDLHLFFTLDSSTEANGNFMMVYIFLGTAVLILLIACINFINLSTARLTQRAKEVGLKKAIGAIRLTLFIQFISEAFIFTAISLVLALGVSYIVLPNFNSFLGKSISFTYLLDPLVAGTTLILLVLVSLAAGGYPAFYLSSFKASEVLKRGATTSWKRFSLRSVLVAVQFMLAFMLIIGVAVVRKQLDFVNSYDVGFNRNSLLVLPSSREIFKKFKMVKEQLEQYPGIKMVSLSSRVPSGVLADSQGASIEVDGKMQELDLRIADIHVDHDYFKVLDLPLAAGRNFDHALASDTLQAFVLNETAVKAIGWKDNEDAIGKVFHYGQGKGSIVGVVKDFNFESLHEPIKPIVFVITRGRARTVVLRIDDNKRDNILKYLEEQWTYLRPGFPFTYYSLTEGFEKQYAKERRVGEGISFFAIFAVFVSSLGVFGLALFMAEQRTKEIGIRKALGADISGIIVLLSKWFFFLMVAAGLVSVPVSYYFAQKWLESFYFTEGVGFTPYIAAFGIIGCCTGLSIIIQIVRSARQNPVHALRYE